MKNIFSCLGIFLFLGIGTTRAQVTIGSPNPPDPSAVLDLQSSQAGFALPRLTTTQRNAIANPVQGLQIYNITTQCLEVYFPSSGWKAIGCDCTTAPPTPLSVSGPVHVCEGAPGELFVVQAVPGALNYVWTVPNQDVLVSGQGNDSLVINFSNTPGTRTISVVASNSCGVSASYSFNVDVSNPDPTFTYSPNTITLNNAVAFHANQPGALYSWTFASGSPANSTNQNPSVTWSNAGQYQVDLTVTDADGCIAQSSAQVNVTSCQPTVYSFTNCGATGRFGPDQNQCNATYGPGVVTVTGGIQNWTVPATGTYQILAVGAGGAGYSGAPNQPGRGASIQGEVALTAGTVLKILVGQKGSDGNPVSSSTYAGGGGGGTFVVTSANVPLIVAGGGNGNNWEGWTAGGPGGKTTNTGTGGGQSESQSSSYGRGGGGGGLIGNGGNYSSSDANGGLSFTNGGTGGEAFGKPGHGGFGGGGATRWEGGGGGGYTGGFSVMTNQYNSTFPAYGAGSYNSGANPVNTANFNSGHGSVIITRICP